MERAKGGDVGAYEELVRRYQGIALRVAALTDGPEADNTVQDALVKAYRALGRFRMDVQYQPWLLRSVANEARNRRRAAGRRAGLALRLADDRDSGDAAPSPESAILDAEDRSTLLAAVASLDERDRMVIGYRYLLGLSEVETAQALDVRPGTVKSRLSRALARLRVRLADEEMS